MKKAFTLLCVILSSLATMANGVEVDSIYYLLDSDNMTASVTYTGESSSSGNNYSGDIVIPDSIYYADQLYSVTTIGYEAFAFCSGLTSIIIPNSVTTIGDYAFENCQGLTSITIPNSVTTIGVDAFFTCSDLTSVTIGNSVTTIGEGAFENCQGLTSVFIGNSVTTIGDVAFNGCSSLTSITIPNSVTTIGSSAFYGCSGLTSIDVDTANTHYTSVDGVLFNYAKDTLIQYPIGNLHTEYTIPNSITTIGRGAFAYCQGLTSATIGNSVTTIGDYAFENCQVLTSITIPNSVTTIGYGAFGNCQGLTSATIGNSVTTIGDVAFLACSGLTSVTIGNSVTTIGESAFEHCSGLTSVTCKAVIPPSLGRYVFDSVPRDIPLYVPASSIPAYQAAEQWNEFNILPLLMDVDPITPDTTKLSWLPVDSASMYQLHIYAEQVGLDTTLYIEADSLNGGIRIPVTMAPKRIRLDDVGSIIVIEIDPYSGINKETPYVVTISTTTKMRIGVRVTMRAYKNDKELSKEEGIVALNNDVVNGIDDVLISNWSSTPSIYDLYGHRYSTNQWSSVPAGVYILREGNKAVKVMKQ